MFDNVISIIKMQRRRYKVYVIVALCIRYAHTHGYTRVARQISKRLTISCRMGDTVTGVLESTASTIQILSS